MKELGIVERAAVYAATQHSGQRRKGSGVPYILHAMEAAAIVSTMTADLDVIAAAMLHDVLEDTGAAFEEITGLFGEKVAMLVRAESEDKRPDRPKSETWVIRKQETLERLAEADERTKMIAMGDKLSNLRSMHRDILVMGDELWQRFNQKDPKMHAWYYKGVADCLESLSHHAAYKEFCHLLDEVFG